MAFKEIFAFVYSQDNLITFDKNLSFFADNKFKAALQKNATTEKEISIAWRVHTLCWAAFNAMKLEGDLVECGVYKAFSFSVVADYLDLKTKNKKLYLYDTFEGIPDAYNLEGHSNEGFLKDKDVYELVKNKFSSYNNVEVVQGILPESFTIKCPEKISLLHVDLNSSKSEIAVLEHLYDRVVPGGFIVFDDFGWITYKQQTLAELEFMKARGQMILEMPTGQGVVIKR